VAVLIAALTAGCTSGASSEAPGGSAALGRAATATVWLCRPGLHDDPCTAPLETTIVPATGARTVEPDRAEPSSRFDCFYVYPTVSAQSTENADLAVRPAERAVAVAQASRFSQVCRVWAPIYRQRTESSLAAGLGDDPRADTVAYESLLGAWKDYLAHHNGGRPIVFIGHSQGAAMLIRLLASQVDPNPALRARTVVAILAGGNVTVPDGRLVGATFSHLPLCAAERQTGCVIAYSSFPSQPPPDAAFGRPGQGVSLQSGQRARDGVHVACVNPAALDGGVGHLDPYFLTAPSSPPPPPVTTPWVSYPDLYTASCRQHDGATWLQVDPLDAAGRPTVTETLGPAWGYHLDDVNLALGNLVDDVRGQEAAFAARH
jgi:hypothetical protein